MPHSRYPTRLRQSQYVLLWVLVALAGIGLVVKVMLDVRTARLEAAVLEKQQFVDQTMPVSRLNGQLVQSLANVAARRGDPAFSELLGTQGIQFTVSGAQ